MLYDVGGYFKVIGVRPGNRASSSEVRSATTHCHLRVARLPARHSASGSGGESHQRVKAMV